MAAIQGLHQVAQNSSTYTRPFSNPGTGSPFNQARTCKGGAGSPIFSKGDGPTCPLAVTVIIDDNRNSRKFDRIATLKIYFPLRAGLFGGYCIKGKTFLMDLFRRGGGGGGRFGGKRRVAILNFYGAIPERVGLPAELAESVSAG